MIRDVERRCATRSGGAWAKPTARQNERDMHLRAHHERRAESALVMFSGGQDSTTCLAWALHHFAHVETVGFDYGQRHIVELACRAPIRDAIGVLEDWHAHLGMDHLIDLTGALAGVGGTARALRRSFNSVSTAAVAT